MRRSPAFLVGLLVIASALALPIGSAPTGATTEALASADFAGEEVLEVEMPVQVVFAGFDPATVDPDVVLAELPPDYEPKDRIHMSGDHEPVRLVYTYEAVFAPEAFAAALFDAALAHARWGPAPAYLLQYDAAPLPGRQRLLDEAQDGAGAKAKAKVQSSPLPVVTAEVEVDADHIRYIDVKAVESWIAANRASYGLAAPAPGFTIFLLDSYTTGHLPTDTYHYYEYRENMPNSHPMANSSPKDWELLHSTAMYVPEPLVDGRATPGEAEQLRRSGGVYALAEATPAGVAYRDPVTGNLYPGNVPNAYDTKERVKTLRGWGGNHDFVFLDVGAAPSNDEDFFLLTPGDSAVFDPPVWDYAYQDGARDAVYQNGLNPYDVAFIGFDVGNFSLALARAAHFGLGYVLAPSLLYHPTTTQRVHVQNWVIYDEGVDVSRYGRDDGDVFDADVQRARLATHSPWTVLTNEVHFVQLPDDDPALAAALREAKAKGAPFGTYVCGTCLKEYFARNAATYIAPPADDPDAKVIPNFLFHLAGTWQVVVPVIPVAISDSTPEGLPFAIFTGLNEPLRLLGYFDLVPGTIHEAGHHLGFSHTHDGDLHEHDEAAHPDDYSSTSHYLWENSESVMGYRTDPFGFNEQERENLARVQAALMVNEAREAAFEALEWAEHEGTALDPAVQAAAGAVGAKLQEARADFASGDWFGALVASDEARALAADLAALTGAAPLASAAFEAGFSGLTRAPVSVDVLNSRCCLRLASTKLSLDLGAAGPAAGRAERVLITAQWTNNATDWGDLFVGYDFDANNFADAVFDLEEEQPGDGPHTLAIAVDPNLHNDGDVLTAYVGSQDFALNAQGVLRAEVLYRDLS